MATSVSVVNIEGSQLRMFVPSVDASAAKAKGAAGSIPGCDFLVSYLAPEELVRRVLQAASGSVDPALGLGSLGLGVKMERGNPYSVKISTLSSHIVGAAADTSSSSSTTSSSTASSANTSTAGDDGRLKVSMPVRLEVEICLVKGYKGLHCIKTKRLAGGVWDYRIVICALLKRNTRNKSEQ
eukprot:gnl/Chilomastix_caulleri/2374.p1 GENE.gnl/Chilomastix_caulleri/2374~~gnl/Chilomastix_caulleri/2374.p1  ORF type:complete len:183 (+),score=57.44 gnl/Chilomastix_caulleri/2374:305-853(+)